MHGDSLPQDSNARAQFQLQKITSKFNKSFSFFSFFFEEEEEEKPVGTIITIKIELHCFKLKLECKLQATGAIN